MCLRLLANLRRQKRRLDSDSNTAKKRPILHLTITTRCCDSTKQHRKICPLCHDFYSKSQPLFFLNTNKTEAAPQRSELTNKALTFGMQAELPFARTSHRECRVIRHTAVTCLPGAAGARASPQRDAALPYASADLSLIAPSTMVLKL